MISFRGMNARSIYLLQSKCIYLCIRFFNKKILETITKIFNLKMKNLVETFLD